MPYENSLKSPGRTLLSSHIPKDRIITKFPQPFRPDASLNQRINFHQKVRDACAQNKTGTVGLKICKGVVVGDVAVGKTSLVNRFCHNVFDRDYKATIGVDFEVEKFGILSIAFNLQLWDTAGQERFKCIAASYYRGSNVVIVVFDLTDVQSLVNCKKWRQDACVSASDPHVFLVGTKKDLLSEAGYEAIEQEAVTMAKDIGAEYWAVSSKTGENVREFFFRAVTMTFDTLVLREVDCVARSDRQIGSDFIKVEKGPDDLFEKKRRLKCCS